MLGQQQHRNHGAETVSQRQQDGDGAEGRDNGKSSGSYCKEVRDGGRGFEQGMR